MNHPHRFHRNHQAFASTRGFTLTELLVTISIIGFLSVLLMPTLSTGTQAANRSKCVNNLRQIQAACSAYAGENNGVYPAPDREYGFPHEFGNYDDLLKPYLQVPRDKIMFCPGLIKVRNGKTPLYDTHYTTYQYFNFDRTFQGTFATNKPDMTRMTTIPNGVPLWGCLTSTKNGNTIAHDQPSIKKPLTGMNAVYPDGHAAWVPTADLEVYYTFDGLSLYWPKPPKNIIQ